MATVNANTGKLAINAIGTAVITATQAGTATHAEGKGNYTLRVTKSDAPSDVKWKDSALSEVWSSGVLLVRLRYWAM